MTIATATRVTCGHCGGEARLTRDEDGELVPHCDCGWWGYKTAKEYGIDPEVEVCHLPRANMKLCESAKAKGATSCFLDCPFKDCIVGHDGNTYALKRIAQEQEAKAHRLKAKNDRLRELLNYKSRGLNFSQIAPLMGMSAENARKIYKNALSSGQIAVK